MRDVHRADGQVATRRFGDFRRKYDTGRRVIASVGGAENLACHDFFLSMIDLVANQPSNHLACLDLRQESLPAGKYRNSL
jgi:hypothetical protein